MSFASPCDIATQSARRLIFTWRLIAWRHAVRQETIVILLWGTVDSTGRTFWERNKKKTFVKTFFVHVKFLTRKANWVRRIERAKGERSD